MMYISIVCPWCLFRGCQGLLRAPAVQKLFSVAGSDFRRTGGSADTARRGTEVLLPAAAPTDAMHLIRISASILSRSNLHAVRSGGASGSRTISPGVTQASRMARWRHGKASAFVSQPLMRGSRILHSWRY
eukprot:6187003-Pleurochrysis_carterae.AAC.6